ncbi:MAG: type II toxin-antitoxin system Phd/YefM family antitoxin [Oscillochloris sp.]|nr:type II toxin-antitoxin system Phd/YefM family antitoxin [Oscillochloris sp.]
MARTKDFNLDVDLQHGMVPISKAASSLAAIIKRSRELRQPVAVTQKGYPVAVLMPIELYSALTDLVRRKGAQEDDTNVPAAE